MGEVYLAATTGIEGAERPCVVKIIRREHAKDTSFLARFLDEARVQAQLHHPGVVQVIEANTDENGEPFVVVEYVEGRSLGEVRARALQVSYRMSWAEAVALATSAAEALAHVHERVDVTGQPLGIVHRDMSPQNIMVGYGGDVKLIDFGTARGENRRCHTVSGVVFAKPGYVAPEVANGNTGDARVDVYALGIMLWELAAGRRFLQGDAAEHLAKVAKDACAPPPIASLVGAPAEMDDIIAKLTAFRTEDRYACARDALRDLARLLSSAPSLSNGERGVRARVSQLMATLYPAEPTQSRRLFAKLVAQAREMDKNGQPATLAVTDTARETPEADERVLPGTRYRVLRKIGEGAMGHVFEAEHIDLGRRVAIKVLAAHHATSSDYAARFRREARALSRLSHPNLVTLHDFGQATDGRLYCAMEFLEGETLDRSLERDGAMSWRDALQLGAQAASALREAHRVGIVHRDLKPSNLFLCQDGTLKLLDFGVARKADEGADPGSDVSSFTLFGTPEYMAPEQVSSGKVDERVDVYALACVLYEMVTGRLPFVADSTVALLDAKTKQDAEPPRDRAPSRGIPAEVDRLIVRALARSPEKRTATAAQLLAEILTALDAPERKRRQRRTVGRVAIFASLAGAILSFSAGLARHYPDQVQTAMSSLMAATAPEAVEAAPLPVAQAESLPAVELVAPTQLAAAPTVDEVSPDPAQPMLVDPQLGETDAVLAERAAQERNWSEAVRAARSWVQASSTRQSQLFLARVLLHTGQDGQAQEARALLEDLYAQDPDCAETRSLLRVSEQGQSESTERLSPKPRVARR
jgi:serine/threonine-protein kinase